MRYVDDSYQEMLTPSPQFPALVIAHQGFDRARIHWHEGLEVLYVRRGQASIVRNGRRSMRQRGDVTIIRPKVLHSIELLASADGSEIPQALSVTLDPMQLLAICPDIFRMQQSVDYGSLETEGIARLAQCCEHMFAAITSGKGNRFFEANAWFYSMLAHLFASAPSSLRNSPTAGIPTGISADDERMAYRLEAYVKTHYLEPLTATQAAAAFGYSREHFSRLFRHYFNTSFTEYLSRMRVQAACELLSDTDRNVSRIARDAGFANTQALRHAFRRDLDCTPLEYRANLAKS